MTKTKILIATHKLYEFPDDAGYLPIHVGKARSALNLDIQTDNAGNNISPKNNQYCELTALYWAWKNLDTDFLGLVHYRRYFKGADIHSSRRLAGNLVASSRELESYLLQGKADILLAKKRNYIVDTIETHYKNAHYAEDLNVIKKIIAGDFPEFQHSLYKVLGSRSASMFNMFFMKKSLADEYASWLFTILEQAEQEIDLTGRTPFQRRVFGFLSEILLNVWVEQKELNIKRLPVVHIEPENLPKKAFNLILRKIDKNKKYDS